MPPAAGLSPDALMLSCGAVPSAWQMYKKGDVHAETGVVVYQANSASRKLVDDMLVYYRHPPPHEVCLDDTCVFSHMVTQLQRGALLREGHLATCAHK